jgi:hypothetical protein
MRLFAKVLIQDFGAQYLWDPNEEGKNRLMGQNEARGWSVMRGSMNCMHRRLKNCLASWHEHYIGHHHDPTTVHVSEDLWIWPCLTFEFCRDAIYFIGLPLANRDAPACKYTSIAMTIPLKDHISFYM